MSGYFSEMNNSKESINSSKEIEYIQTKLV